MADLGRQRLVAGNEEVCAADDLVGGEAVARLDVAEDARVAVCGHGGRKKGSDKQGHTSRRAAKSGSILASSAPRPAIALPPSFHQSFTQCGLWVRLQAFCVHIRCSHYSVFSCRMSYAKALRYAQNRTFVSSVFGATFFAAVVTVSASSILPCPVRPDKSRFMEDDTTNAEILPLSGKVIIAKRPRRWIEEKQPTCQSFPSDDEVLEQRRRQSQ